jgi:uncharacterized protein (DUF2147 family)
MIGQDWEQALTFQEDLMRKLLALAAVLMATSSAQAGETYSFDIGGRTIKIETPNGCDSPSCVSVSIPGVYESGPKRGKRSRIDQDDDYDSKNDSKPAQQTRVPQTSPNPAPPTTTATAPAAPAAPAPTGQSLEPANGPPAQPSTTANLAPSPAPAATPAPAPSTSPAPVVAAAPAAAPVQNQQVPPTSATSPTSPLGVWWTEEKEGKVRIEACGVNLCGYSMKDNEKILINMKPVSDGKWKGRIHDPKSGSDYDSTIALKGTDSLRVQGCAFGGMFCGGQTWSRVN